MNGSRSELAENPRDAMDDPSRCTAGFGERGKFFFCQREANHDGLHRNGTFMFGDPPEEPPTGFICGGSGKLTPEARAELDAFANHLRTHRDADVSDCRFCAEGAR